MSDYGITLSNPSPVIGTAAHQLEEIIFFRNSKPTPTQKCLVRKIGKPAKKGFMFRRRDIVYAWLLPAVDRAGSRCFVMNNVLRQCGLPYRSA
jgi:hypothetical protein